MLTNLARSAGTLLALAAAPVTAGVAGATGAAVVHTVAAEPADAPVPPSEDVQPERARNHGDFVREQREAGLRGRDLAGAIHEEKGISPPGHAKARPDRGQDRKGEGGARGRAGERGKSHTR